MINSIAGRLALWVLVAVSAFSIGFGVFLYERQRETSMAMIDDGLRSKAEFFAALIEIYPEGSVHFEPAEQQDRYPTLYDTPGSGRYYQILFEDGRPLARSRSLGGYVFPVRYEDLQAKPHLETVAGPDGEPVRVYAQRVTVSPAQDNAITRTFLVETGESLRETERFLGSLRQVMFYSVPFILFLSAIGGVLIAWVSLRPLKRFSAEIGEIGERTLDKRILPERVSKELRELATSFNAMLDRIQKVFAQQRRFVSDASHELRTPVSVIKSYCEVPLRRDRTVEEYKQRLGTILHHTEKMSGLIDSLLTLSRLEHKSLPLVRERVDLNRLVGAAIALLTPLAERKGVRLRAEPAAAAVHAWGDHTGLAEALTNLVENAIKYTAAGGRVVVRVERTGDEAVVAVEDTGVGIPPEALPHLFDRFYRVDSSRTAHLTPGDDDDSGFGLGLSIAKELIDAHHGRIDVASEVGKGSVFTIRLSAAT